ncbi:MAG: hypothetical protein WC718_05590 [Phycisphaerales bacterium]|jgi:cell shape-determining protein MreD
MRGVTFALLAWIFLGLELGLKSPLGFGPSGVAPSFMFVLLTYIAMAATPKQTAWAAIILGVLMDLTNPFTLHGKIQPAVVVGPYALSFLLGSQLVLTLRGVMIRRNPFTLGFLALVGSIVASITLVGVFSARAFLENRDWHATHELWVGMKCSLYTGIAAVPLALVLMPLGPFLGLPGPQARRFARPNSG